MQPHEDDSFVIGVGGDIVTLDDDLLERIANLPERIQFLVLLDFIGQGVGRLDVILVNAVGDNEIDFVLDIDLLSIPHLASFDQTHVNHIVPGAEFVVYDVLHDVGDFLLAEVQPGIPQPHIHAVVLLEGLVILFPLDVIPAGTFKEEGVADVAQILLDGFFVYFDILDALQGVGHLGRIGQRADG